MSSRVVLFILLAMMTHFLLPALIAGSLHAGLPLLVLFIVALLASGARTAFELSTVALPLVAATCCARPCARCGTCRPTTHMYAFHARACMGWGRWKSSISEPWLTPAKLFVSRSRTPAISGSTISGSDAYGRGVEKCGGSRILPPHTGLHSISHGRAPGRKRHVRRA